LAPQHSRDKPRFTGTITLRYTLRGWSTSTRRPRLNRGERRKTFNAGYLADDEGITVEAEGVFIQPRWARN